MASPDSPAKAALDRVRKLLALATSDNPHEAAVAAARAQALIETHRLQGWLDAEHAVRDDPDPIIDAREEPLEVVRRIRVWKTALASVLAQSNGCVAYTFDRGRDTAIVLVGRARDRAIVTELWQWFVKRIEWLSATKSPGQSKKSHDAFRLGVVDAIAERLREGVDEARRNFDQKALVRVDPAQAAHREALDRFVEETLQLRPGRAIRVDADAWERGQDAADELELPSSRSRS